MSEPDITKALLDGLGWTWTGAELFDSVPDIAYFLKDQQGRYLAVNMALVDRCGVASKNELIGKTAEEVYPAPLGTRFSDQDRQVISENRPIHGALELHLYPNGKQGWCLTWKEPIVDIQGTVVGVSGISRDLPEFAEVSASAESLADLLQYIGEHLDQPLPLAELAERIGLSVYQLDQRIRNLFRVTAGQYITRRRIEHACHLLKNSDEAISGIALDCGYSDQSAFTRQFRQSVGLPPGEYRERCRDVG